jgi:hypothetical protein
MEHMGLLARYSLPEQLLTGRIWILSELHRLRSQVLPELLVQLVVKALQGLRDNTGPTGSLGRTGPTFMTIVGVTGPGNC